MLVVDHLLIATPDLEVGCEYLQSHFGIKPVIGGVHPAYGTCNALLALSDTMYIELIAPDPLQSQNFPLKNFLGQLEQPGLMWWAARCDNLDELVRVLHQRHCNIADIQPGSRTLPDGGELSWRLLMTNEPVLGSVMPFFIEWQDIAAHPSSTLPVVGDLSSFHIYHPQAEKLQSYLGSGFHISEAENAGFSVEINTGHKRVSLSTSKQFTSGFSAILLA